MKKYCGDCKHFKSGYYPLLPECRISFEWMDDLYGKHKVYPHSNLMENKNYDCIKHKESSILQKIIRFLRLD